MVSSPPRVLIVDDQENWRKALSILLSRRWHPSVRGLWFRGGESHLGRLEL